MQPNGQTPSQVRMYAPMPCLSNVPHLQVTPYGELDVSQLRKRIKSRVELELRFRHPHRLEWQSKCPMMATQVEDVLYKRSRNLREYGDESTITARLEQLATSRSAKKRNVDEMELNTSVQPCLLESIFNKARAYWLEPAEVDIVFNQLYGKMPVSSAVPLPGAERFFVGKLFHRYTNKPHDSLHWSTVYANPTPGTRDLNERYEVIMSSMGQPKLFMAQLHSPALRLWKRVYYSVLHPGRVLVHYLSELQSVSSLATHETLCECLECKNVCVRKGNSNHRSLNTLTPAAPIQVSPSMNPVQMYAMPARRFPHNQWSFIDPTGLAKEADEYQQQKRQRHID